MDTNLLQGLGDITYRFYFIFVGFNILITIPTIWFTFKETTRLSLEEIDLLFGERALGTLPQKIEEVEAKNVSAHVEEKHVEAA